jgi:predicted DNA binding CopG/RHH family protein
VDDSQRQGACHYGLSGQRFGQKGVSGEAQMTKKMEEQPKRVMPAFANEAEEAAWWYKNRNIHGKQMLAAVESGEAQVLTKEKLRGRIAASKKTPAPVVALRIPEADLALARKQAEQKGLPYQTYIKSLLHETLAAREKRKVG